ncbi:MAG: cupin domain-containing protein [Pseudonocardiaceae bacterium]
MIVSSIRGLIGTVDDTRWRCLARRGMLHSECEAFDYLWLAPGAVRDGRGQEGVEQAWFVLSGEGEFLDSADRSLLLRAGDLVLRPGGTGGWLRSSSASSLELLAFAVLPAAVTKQLPARRPVAATE